MASIDGEEYLTADQAARLLGVKAATLYAYVSRGVLPSYRQGIRRRSLYRRSDVEQLLALRPGGSSAGPAEPGVPLPASAAGVPRAEDWIPFVN